VELGGEVGDQVPSDREEAQALAEFGAWFRLNMQLLQ
jgi:hypothetical protein